MDILKGLRKKAKNRDNDAVEAVKVVSSFDPGEELAQRRFIFDEDLGVGQFNKPYYQAVYDINSDPFELVSFPGEYVGFVDRMLQPVAFVPDFTVLEDWLRANIGDNWRDRPDKLLEMYGNRCSDDRFVYVATNSLDREGRRMFLVIAEDRAYFQGCNALQWGIIPVFFGKEYLPLNYASHGCDECAPVSTSPCEERIPSFLKGILITDMDA